MLATGNPADSQSSPAVSPKIIARLGYVHNTFEASRDQSGEHVTEDMEESLS